MTAMTLVDFICRTGGEGPALPGGESLDHVALCNAADAIGSALVARGVEPGDRVASALPAGALLVASLIGAAAIRAALAPLPAVADEPSARGALRDRRIRVLLAPASLPAAIRSAAAAQRIPVVTLGFDERGLVLVDGEHVYESHDRLAEPQDLAYVPPAGAPLTHAELVAHAGGRGAAGLFELLGGGGTAARHAA
jgi:acyl-CoA synthetase (AMP-forming)/AMP-acid ligase II